MAIESIQKQPHQPSPRQARRSISLFWPIMLIGAGVLLILNNQGKLSGDGAGVLISYWPMLLIVAGIDILFSRTGWLGTLISVIMALAVVIGAAYLLMTPGAAGLPLGERLTFPGGASLHTDHLSQPLANVKNARVELSLAGGASAVTALSDSANLFDGTYVHRGAFNQKVSGTGSDATVQLGQPQGVSVLPLNASSDRMDLGLNTAARYDMQLSVASGKHVFNLSELSMRSVAVNVASGAVELSLPTRGPYPVDVNMASGSIAIIVPAGVPVRVNASGLSGSIRGELVQRVSGNSMSGVYETPGFSRSGAYLELNVNMLSGSVEIR